MYDSLAYPHSLHRRYVRGCIQCLERTRAGQRRMNESRRRAAEHRRAQSAAYREVPRCVCEHPGNRHDPDCDVTGCTCQEWKETTAYLATKGDPKP